MLNAYLLHVSHYDPAWRLNKAHEERFDADTGIAAARRLQARGFDAIIVDCADGVAYQSHPELRRPYTVPPEALSPFVAAAKTLGLDLVPKLNFSKSGRNRHDQWMAPHADLIDWTGSIDRGVYWRVAEDLIAELVALFRPHRYFHIGMDEDHYRSVGQYAETIVRLDRIVKRHGLRTVVWNDSCYCGADSPNKCHADKCEAAEALVPHDIVQTLWEYDAPRPEVLARLKREGFETWIAPGMSPEKIEAWMAVARDGGADGLVMTHWIKCSASNRDALLAQIDRLGPFYAK